MRTCIQPYWGLWPWMARRKFGSCWPAYKLVVFGDGPSPVCNILTPLKRCWISKERIERSYFSIIIRLTSWGGRSYYQDVEEMRVQTFQKFCHLINGTKKIDFFSVGTALKWRQLVYRFAKHTNMCYSTSSIWLTKLLEGFAYIYI